MKRTQERLEFDVIKKKVLNYGYGTKVKEKINNLSFLTDELIIKEQLILVNEMSSLVKRFGRLPLFNDYDNYQLLEDLKISKTLYRDDFITLFNFANLTVEIKDGLKDDVKNYHNILNIYNDLIKMDDVIKLFNSYFDHNFLILNSISPVLKKLRSDHNRVERSLSDVVSSSLKKYQKYLTESISVMRNGRYCIPVNISYKNSVNGVIHDYSASYQTVYIEPVENLNIFNELENIKKEITNEELKIYHELTLKLKEYYEVYLNNFYIVNKLDFIHAKALYANEIDAVMPEFSKDGDHLLINAHHPLLDKDICVPIDIIFEKNTKMILLTGANTGGKTVSLKTLGLLTLMLQAGLLIPVSERSKVKIFKDVFIDVGDEQSIEQSLSTFSAHLTNILKMIEKLDNDVLILLDEIGSGTDPKEGSSIAKALIDELLSYNLKALVTTHYSELKEFGLSKTPIVKLARLKFNLKTLTPEYVIEYDLVGSSHALLIAKRLGFNEKLINRANNYFEASKTDVERIQEALSSKEESLNTYASELALEKEKLEQKIIDLTNQEKAFEVNSQKYLLKLETDLKKQYEPLIKKANEIIDELKDQLTQREVAELKGSLNIVKKEEIKDLSPLKVGDYVYVLKYDQYGYIEKKQKDLYHVGLGSFTLTFKRSDLVKEEDPNEKAKLKEVKLQSQVITKDVKRDASYEIDLRGMRFAEVDQELDQAFDKAYLSNLGSVKIIHGYGTGALKKAVDKYLKKSPYVNNYRSGGEKEGMLGVTIVTLK